MHANRFEGVFNLRLFKQDLKLMNFRKITTRGSLFFLVIYLGSAVVSSFPSLTHFLDLSGLPSSSHNSFSHPSCYYSVLAK